MACENIKQKSTLSSRFSAIKIKLTNNKDIAIHNQITGGLWEVYTFVPYVWYKKCFTSLFLAQWSGVPPYLLSCTCNWVRFHLTRVSTHSVLDTFTAQWMGNRVDMVLQGSAPQRNSVSTLSGLSWRHAVCNALSPYMFSWFIADASREANIYEVNKTKYLSQLCCEISEVCGTSGPVTANFRWPRFKQIINRGGN